MTIKQLHTMSNVLGLLLLSLLLIITFYVQIAFHHLPCPLCLLQRVGVAGVGTAIIFNLTLTINARHYGFMLLSALLGLGAALRHLFLHITPGALGYGAPIFGLHLYTWSALIFAFILIATSMALLLEQGFHKPKLSLPSKISIYLFMSLIALNALSSFLECGIKECPGDPEIYQMLS